MKKFKCSVCGYIHNGNEPPETCPVCGATKDKFVKVIETASDAQNIDNQDIKNNEVPESSIERPKPIPIEKIETLQGDSEKSNEKYEIFKEKFIYFSKKISKQAYLLSEKLILKHHIHPRSVHVPNGVLPAAVIFVILAMFFQIANMQTAAFYNLIFVLIAMPLVLFSGYIDWKNKYNQALTNVFLTKMICGGIVFTAALSLVIWQIANPSVFKTHKITFLIINLIMLAAAGVAGHFGGKLVFFKKEK